MLAGFAYNDADTVTLAAQTLPALQVNHHQKTINLGSISNFETPLHHRSVTVLY